MKVPFPDVLYDLKLMLILNSRNQSQLIINKDWILEFTILGLYTFFSVMTEAFPMSSIQENTSHRNIFKWDDELE